MQLIIWKHLMKQIYFFFYTVYREMESLSCDLMFWPLSTTWPTVTAHSWMAQLRWRRASFAHYVWKICSLSTNCRIIMKRNTREITVLLGGNWKVSAYLMYFVSDSIPLYTILYQSFFPGMSIIETNLIPWEIGRYKRTCAEFAVFCWSLY